MDSAPLVLGGSDDFSAGDLRYNGKHDSHSLACNAGDFLDAPEIPPFDSPSTPISTTTQTYSSSTLDSLPHVGSLFDNHIEETHSVTSSSAKSDITTSDDGSSKSLEQPSKSTRLEREVYEIMRKLTTTRAQLYSRAKAYLQDLQVILDGIARELSQLRAQTHTMSEDERPDQTAAGTEQGILGFPLRTRSSHLPSSNPGQLPSVPTNGSPSHTTAAHSVAGSSSSGPAFTVNQAGLSDTVNNSSKSLDQSTQDGLEDGKRAPHGLVTDEGESDTENTGYLCLDHPFVTEHGDCEDERRHASMSTLERHMEKQLHRFYAHARCRTTFNSKPERDAHVCSPACQNRSCLQHIPGHHPLMGQPSTCPQGCIISQDQLYVILLRLRHGDNVRRRVFRHVTVPAKPRYVPDVTSSPLPQHPNEPRTPIPYIPHGSGPFNPLSHADGSPFTTLLPFVPGIPQRAIDDDPVIQNLIQTIQLLFTNVEALQRDVMYLRQQAPGRDTHVQGQPPQDVLNRQHVVTAFQVMFHAQQNPGLYTEDQLRGMVREVLGDEDFEFRWLSPSS